MLTLRTLLASACLLLPSVSVYASGAHWTYQGDQGPAHWGEESALCAVGKAQSPVDIDRQKIHKQAVNSKTLQVHYRQSSLKLVNNGHSIQASPQEVQTLSFRGERYRLVQFHFHTPSEHLLDHRPYPMEMHLVNQADDGRLLVLGVMIAEGQENTQLAQIWRAMPEKAGQEVDVKAAAAPDLASLLPQGSHHFYYSGSLTTPPCSEGVQWVIYEKPVELSTEQIGRFRKLYPDNHRPAEALAGREVDED